MATDPTTGKPAERNANGAGGASVPPPRRRLWLTLTIGVLGLAAAGWTVAWQVTAMITEAALESWMEQRRALGERLVHTGQPERSGFPLEIRHDLRQPVWEIRRGPDTVRLEGPVLTVVNTPVAPLTLRLEMSRGITATVPGRGLTASGDRLDAGLRLGDGGPGSGRATIAELSFRDRGGRPIAKVERVTAAARREDAASGPIAAVPIAAVPIAAVPTVAVVDLTVDGLTLAERFRPMFDGPAALSGRAALLAPLPALDRDALLRWRQAGGALDVRSLSVDWGPLNLRGAGTFALDAGLRPEGAATVSAAGLPATMDRLAELGWMERGQVGWVKLALAALSRRPEAGGPPRVTAPLTIQDGVVSLGPARLGQLGPVLR